MADDIKLVVGVDYSELTGLVKTSQQTKRVLSSAANEFARTGNQKQYMHSINKIVLSQKQLDASSRMSRSQLMKLGAEMQREVKFTDALTASTSRLGGAMGASKNRMNGNNMAIQQLGYQFGDFAVQVQGGTSAFVAFSQQGAQLAGILPMIAGPLGLSMGAAVGLSAALGILIPIGSALARMFFEMRDSAKEAEGSIKSLKDQMVSAKEATVGFADEIERLNLGLKDANEQSLFRGVQEAAAAVRALESAEVKRGDRAGATLILREAELTIARALVTTRQEELDAFRAGRAERDALVDAQEESLRLEEALRKAAEDYKDMVEATTRSQADQLALATKIFVYGKDHLQVAKLRAEQEGISKGLVGEALQEYVSMEMVIRDVVSATEEAADEAKRLVSNLSKISFPNLGMSDAMLAIQYQELGELKGDAPTTPVAAKVTRAGGSGSSNVIDINDIINARKEQIAQDRVLLGLSGEQQEAQKIYYDLLKKNEKADVQLTNTELRGAADAIAAYEEQNRVIEENRKQQEDLADYIANSMGDALMSVVDGTMSVKDAFKSMATDIIKELYRVLVVQQMVNAAKTAMGFFADGGVISGGTEVQAYANGGVVNGPTTFPMSGGKTGLMGEAGPEAIMPLKRGSNGKLGVQMEGGGGDTINVVQNFNFQANGDDTVKKLIAQAAPKIAQMTKSSLLDDRRRGGSTKAAFG